MKEIDWEKVLIPIKSSNLNRVYWDKKNCTLYVEFKNKAIYAYLGVPESKFRGLVQAQSAGEYLRCDIKYLFASNLIKEGVKSERKRKES